MYYVTHERTCRDIKNKKKAQEQDWDGNLATKIKHHFHTTSISDNTSTCCIKINKTKQMTT